MNDLIAAVSTALVHFVWQGALVALLLALALRAIRDAKANLRYTLAVGALALMLLLPLGTIVLSLANVESNVAAETSPAAVRSSPTSADDLRLTAAPAQATRWSGFTLRSESVRVAIVTIWLLGVVAFTLINTGGWLHVQHLRRSGRPIELPGWESQVARLRERLGVRRWVAVLESTRVDVPTLIGWLRPVVLIPPAALIGISPRALEALLLHELAHVRRHDYAVNLLQATLESLLFYHPAVWWVSRRVRAEREHCCDDLAVESCGSRSAYLHALAEMERFRVASPRLALAADGGSLMDRVRRLTGTKRPRHGSSTRWVLGFVTVMVAAVVGLTQLAGVVPIDARDRPASDALERNRSDDLIEGTWSAKIGRRGEVWLQVERDGRGRHQMSFTLDASEFSGTGDDGIPGFMLQRDAGTFFFDGHLDERRQGGSFEFRPDRDYARRMRAIGFDADDSTRRHFEYAGLDLSLEFAQGIADAGYGEISMSRLTEFRIHGVSPEFVRGMADAGFEGLSAARLVEFKIHGISPEFVREMAESGFEGLTASKLVEFRIHGVSPEFVREMAASGFNDLTPQRLVEFRIHGISPEFVRAMAGAGYDEIGASRLVEFRIHGVSPEFVGALARLGLDDISPRKLVEMRIHGVSPDFIESARDRYGDDLSVQELIELRIHGGSRRSSRLE